MKYTPDYWQDLFAQLAPDLPWPRMREWIKHESGGNPAALGAVYEVGIVQLDLQDGPAWGATIDQLHGDFSVSPSSQTLARDLTDEEEQLQVTSAAAYVRSTLTRARNLLAANELDWSEDDVWCVVKLFHALPDLAVSGIPLAASQAQAGSWDQYRAYMESLPSSALPRSSRYSPWSRLFDNAELVGKLGLGGALDGFASTEFLTLLAVVAGVYLLARTLG